MYMHRKLEMKMKVVDGTSLAVAVTVNIIPKGTTQVLLRDKLIKVAYALVFALCQKGLQVLPCLIGPLPTHKSQLQHFTNKTIF